MVEARTAQVNEVKSLNFISETANSSLFAGCSHYSLQHNDVSFENNSTTNDSSFEGCSDYSLPFNDVSYVNSSTDNNYIQTFADDFNDEHYLSLSSECVDDITCVTTVFLLNIKFLFKKIYLEYYYLCYIILNVFVYFIFVTLYVF